MTSSRSWRSRAKVSDSSRSISRLGSAAEARDYYDGIEWAARQSWCTGRVGTSGVSYFAMVQWLVANLKPPSLKAMIPWEGAADMYCDFGYHGGIFSFGFVTNWYNNHMAHHLLGKSQQATAPDAFSKPWVWEYMRHSLDSDWYHGRRGMGQDRHSVLQRGQLERHGSAPARQRRRLHARRITPQEAPDPRRHALPSVLLGRGAPRPVAWAFRSRRRRSKKTRR